MRSRVQYTIVNFIWSMLNMFVVSVASFITRTVFVYTLGNVYLGVQGLFTNMLGLLSLAELGMESAVSFSLYRPLAEGNRDKICRIMNFYRSAYRMIALVIFIAGLSMVPFLPYIAKGAENVDHLVLIYILYLVNTASSYLITYRSTLLSADQKKYMITNTDSAVRLTGCMLQIFALAIWKDFIAYLVVDLVCQCAGRIYLNWHTVKEYPYLRQNKQMKLSDQEKRKIFTKIKGLVFHKFGEVVIYQTDSIIISAFLNVAVVGAVSNFVMIINFANKLISSIFHSAVAGLGNLIATEQNDRKEMVFKRCDFLAFWLYGVSAVSLYFLLEPVIGIWLGRDKLIDHATLSLLCMNFYLTGQRVSAGNVKMAGGIFEQDWWSPVLQALLNLVVSVFGAAKWGLKGVYIGTLVSSMVPNIVRPVIIYKYIFENTCIEYFKQYLARAVLVMSSAMLISWLTAPSDAAVSVSVVFVRFLVCVAVTNLLFFLFFRKSEEFLYFSAFAGRLSGKFGRLFAGRKK